MNRTWKGGAAAALLLAAVGTAPARGADIPVSAPALKAAPTEFASWSGFYVGGAIGARWSHADTHVSSWTQTYLGPIVQDNIAACAVLRSPCINGPGLDATSFRASPYLGYNWQLDRHWVVGVEADWGWAKNSSTYVGQYYPMNFFLRTPPGNTFAVEARWDASARARLGYLVTPNVLLYATGGAGWMDVRTTSTCDASPTGFCPPGGLTPPVLAHSKTLSGFTAGGGLEAMLSRNWILRGEYRYAQFGTFSASDARVCTTVPSLVCGTQASEAASYDVKLRTHAAMFGIAYKFEPFSVVAKH